MEAGNDDDHYHHHYDDDDDDDDDDHETAAAPMQHYACKLECKRSKGGSAEEHNTRYHSQFRTFGCGWEDDAGKCNFLATLQADVVHHLRNHHQVGKTRSVELALDLYTSQDWPAEKARQQARLDNEALGEKFLLEQKEQRKLQTELLKAQEAKRRNRSRNRSLRIVP